jgi:hypothetical protein
MKTLVFAALLGVAAGTSRADDDTWNISKLDMSKLPPPSTKTDISYQKDIRLIFENACFKCHGEEKHKADLRLDSLEAVLKGGEDAKIVEPGKSDKSLLVAAIARVNDDVAMPPKMKPRKGGPGGPPGPGGPGPGEGRPRARPEGGPQGRGPGGPGGGHFGPPKPLTADQVGLVRAWIDQGAKP